MIWDLDITMDEKMMLWFLLDCSSRFNKDGEWFNLTDEDFIKAGYGKNKSRWKKYRYNLIKEGYIDYKKGYLGNKSEYKIGDKIMQYIGTLKIENNRVVGAEYLGKDDNIPSVDIQVENNSMPVIRTMSLPSQPTWEEGISILRTMDTRDERERFINNNKDVFKGMVKEAIEESYR